MKPGRIPLAIGIGLCTLAISACGSPIDHPVESARAQADEVYRDFKKLRSWCLEDKTLETYSSAWSYYRDNVHLVGSACNSKVKETCAMLADMKYSEVNFFRFCTRGMKQDPKFAYVCDVQRVTGAKR